MRTRDNTSQSPAVAGALHGIYCGFQYQTLAGPIMAESGISSAFITFYADGRVFEGFAIEGSDAYDPDTDPVHGRYRRQGDMVEINWSGQAAVASHIAADGSLVFYDLRYAPIPGCDGLALDGSYGRDWSNEYVQHKTIRFTADGRFEDGGVLTQTSLSVSSKYLAAPPSWSNYRPLTGSGAYRVRNNTLYLDYDHGARETIAILIRPEHIGQKPVPEIELGGWGFEYKGA